MYFTGFADEAADSIEGQIKATRELGWRNIESRNIGGVNIHDLPDAEFDRVAGVLEDAGVQVNCFGSAIANWGKQITDPFDITLAEIRRAIPRMQRLKTRLIRIMSYAVLKDRSPADQMEQERFKRVREIRRMFDDAGITPVHENCMNYGGMGWTYTLKLVENVPGLKLVYDTGNPIFTPEYIKGQPYPRQSSWEFYSHVRDHVAYIHIKDGNWIEAGQKQVFTFPEEGKGDIRRILTDLLKRGYDGGISIEPHLGSVYHDLSQQAAADKRHQLYVDYGRRMEKMVAEIRAARKTGK